MHVCIRASAGLVFACGSDRVQITSIVDRYTIELHVTRLYVFFSA